MKKSVVVPPDDHAAPLDVVAQGLKIPRSTIDKLIARGEGPRAFKIGRRWYVRHADRRAWIDSLAKAK